MKTIEMELASNRNLTEMENQAREDVLTISFSVRKPQGLLALLVSFTHTSVTTKHSTGLAQLSTLRYQRSEVSSFSRVDCR
jgi:hypothetical protein